MPVNLPAKSPMARIPLWFVLMSTLGLVLLWETASYAHKVYVFAWNEGDTVHTESYFGSNNKVQGGLIRVYDLAGNKILEGHTNKQGEFSFKAPKNTDLRIVLEAGMGHKGEYTLTKTDLSDTGECPPKAQKDAIGNEMSNSGINVNTEQIRTVVEQALEARLKPIIRELALLRKQRGPGITEVIGGIGYIIGIMGTVMYLRSRKKK